MTRSFRTSLVLAALLALTITPSQSQVTFKLGGGLGVVLPAADLKGSTIDFYNGTNYGLGNGLNLQAKAKVGLVGFNLTGEIDYASLSNSGDSEPGQGAVDISQKILSLKVGPEFRLAVPLSPITPYIGANIALNTFSGETTFQGVAKVPSATYTANSVSRVGIGFSGGVEVGIGPLLALDFNLAYNLLNVSGKSWEDVNPGTNQRIDSYLALNDAADPLYAAGDDKHFIANSRSMHSIVFTTSILFGL